MMSFVAIPKIIVLHIIIADLVKSLKLDQIFITVKTSKHFQHTRLPVILDTWFQNAKEQTWFITDINNPEHQNITNGHMFVVNCESKHTIKGLCCKMAAELYLYYKQSRKKKWVCHFDDDNYVNIPALVELLSKYNYDTDWYLGRFPYKYSLKYNNSILFNEEVKFQYATLGAGCCMTRGLVVKIRHNKLGRDFSKACYMTGLSDDITLAIIIELLLNVRMTTVEQFNSHLDRLYSIPTDTLKNQITLSYHGNNVINIPGLSKEIDPTRFYSLHCHLSKGNVTKCLKEVKRELDKKPRKKKSKGYIASLETWLWGFGDFMRWMKKDDLSKFL